VKDSTKDKIEGNAKKVAGTVKALVGQTFHKPRLEEEGAEQKAVGKVQAKIGEIEKVLND